jgi:hypothetical protein
LRQKIERFLWRDFSGEEFLPRTAFSGKKCRSILSNNYSRDMDLELLVAQSEGNFLRKRVLFLETKEHPQISNASFWKRGRENGFLQMF